MKQYSIYMKYFVNKDKAEASLKRISGNIPLYGSVSCLFITDKQFGNTQNFYGKKQQNNEKKPEQFDFFKEKPFKNIGFKGFCKFAV